LPLKNRRVLVNKVEDVEVAEARMNAAREALLNYVERREQLDGEQYRRLVTRVKKAEAEFMNVVASL
jgi:hypothetical protein